MTAVPESMITWSGTRHKVSSRPPERSYMADHQCYEAACNSNFPLDTSEQDRPHRGDCKRCFPATADSGSGTPADLERARDVAVALEQQDARLRQRISELLNSDEGRAVHENTSEGTRFVNTLRQILLAGDAP